MKNGWHEDYFGGLVHFINNEWHNEKGPAVIWETGSKLWCQNNNLHRLDGPAMEYSDGDKYWYYQGKRIECKSQKEFERYLKLKLLW